jgi:hypothetical protein
MRLREILARAAGMSAGLQPAALLDKGLTAGFGLPPLQLYPNLANPNHLNTSRGMASSTGHKRRRSPPPLDPSPYLGGADDPLCR